MCEELRTRHDSALVLSPAPVEIPLLGLHLFFSVSFGDTFQTPSSGPGHFLNLHEEI